MSSPNANDVFPPDASFDSSRMASDFQSVLSSMARSINDGTIEEQTKPLKVTRELQKKIKQLPCNNQVWFADRHKEEMQEQDEAGTFCFVKATVGHVLKEKGSNGKPWHPNQAQNQGNVQEECDGLGLSIAVCSEQLKNTYTVNVIEEARILLGTIAKGCLHPCCLIGNMSIPGLSGTIPPGRPRKVLFASSGVMNDLAGPLKKMGIKQVGIADQKIIESMRSSALMSMDNSVSPETMTEFLSNPDSPFAMSEILQASTKNMTESCYVNEERIPLGGWRPEPDVLDSYPLDYWARPPEPSPQGYRHTMLFGWRTNLELACDRADTAKVQELCAKHSQELARDHAERRLLLNKAASKGLLMTCKVLIEDVGVGVDSVQSSDNKAEWRNAQKGSGNNNDVIGSTPLIYAAQEGHTVVVKYLLSKGARANLTDLGIMRATALHRAVIGGHLDTVKLLVRSGADPNARDGTGSTPIMLASACFDGIIHGKEGSEAHRKITVFLSNPEANVDACFACGKVPKRSKSCPCGMEIYCNTECQRARWKRHKPSHKMLMEALGKS